MMEASDASVAQYKASTILSSEANQHSLHLRLGPDSDSPSVGLPPESLALLRHLAKELNANIYMFSTRAKSIAFKPPDATHSMGFLHRVDSKLGISEYLVLIASRHVEPAVARPPQNQVDGSIPFKSAVFRSEERTRSRLRPRSTVSDEQCHEGVKRAL